MIRVGRYLTILLLVLTGTGLLRAETYSLTPTDDMYTDPEHAAGHSLSELWTADWSPVSNYQRINLKFDLSSLNGAEIQSATLKLYRFFGCPSGDPTTTTLYAITQEWTESDWPETMHSPHGDAAWANHVFTENGWNSIDITTLVQAWQGDTIDNHGLVIVASSSKFTKCYSKEAPNAEYHPTLDIVTVEQSAREDLTTMLPEGYELSCYPNPFNATSNITFTLHKQQHIRLSLFNTTGKEVVSLINSTLQPGHHQTSLNARHLATGIYFILLQTDQQQTSQKILLLR